MIVLSETLDLIVSSGYTDIENQIVSKNVERVLSQFNQEYSNLQSEAFDWAVWNDTYTFVNDRNENYIQMNLQYEIFYNIRTNFMLFYNNNDSLVFSKAFDFVEGNETHLSPLLFTYIDENKKSLLNHQDLTFNRSGIILFSENETPCIVSISPIVHSNGEGPIQGTLIVGRFLDEERLQSIENITQLAINIYPYTSHPPSSPQQGSLLVQGKPVYIQPVNSTYIAGYTIIDDIVGRPVFTLEVVSNRYISNQGAGLIQNVVLSLFIIMIVFIVLIIIILDRFVTSRLTYLSKSVSDIKSSGDLSKKLQTKGNDEIAILGKKIDTMLTSLHKAWTMKDVAEMSLEKKIDELERFKSITIDREMKMMELKKQLAEFKANTGEKK